jgi:hypothetical protein
VILKISAKMTYFGRDFCLLLLLSKAKESEEEGWM